MEYIPIWKKNISHSFFFFLSGFSLETLTIHRTAGEGRGPSFIPLYHFHPLMNIETFICNFACKIFKTRIFNCNACVLPLDEIYHLIELPFEWLVEGAMFACLLDELLLGFCYSDLTLETGGLELTSNTTLALQASRLTECASHILSQVKHNR